MKEITYSQFGDYLIPNLELPQQENVTLGKYGMQRHTYLKIHKRGLYAKLILSGKLQDHLADIDLQVRELLQKIMYQASKERKFPGKVNRQLEWVGAMNELKHEAEEIALHQIIYK